MHDMTRRTALASGMTVLGSTALPDRRISMLPGSGTLGATAIHSWLDFIPAGKHAAILEGSSKDDLTPVLQRMLDELPPCALVFAPGRVNIEGSLTLRRSITLFGIAGRENFDNSWDNGGQGTEIIYRGNDGDAVRIVGATEGNHCFNVMLRDFIVRGNRLDDRGRSNAAARSGSGIAVVGSMEETSNIRIDMDNVHVAQAVDHGIRLSGYVFGGSIRNAFLHRNGGNGLRAEGAGVGEFWLARLRLFQNGRGGSRPQDQAGLLWRAGTVVASQLSASESGGAGVMLAGGPIQIDGLQLESNGKAVDDPRARRQAVVGVEAQGTPGIRLNSIMSDPGADFEGAHVELARGANNIQLSGMMVEALGTGGRHIVRRQGSQNLDITGLIGWRVVADASNDGITRAGFQVIVRSDARDRARTGDGTVLTWRPAAIQRNDLSPYDPQSGAFTAPLSGLYAIDVAMPLRGIEPHHRTAIVELRTAAATRRFRLGNLGAMRDDDGYFTAHVCAQILLAQGDRLHVLLTVAGGLPSIADAGDGFLTISLA